MTTDFIKLLKQLWQQKAATTAAGMVTYESRAQRTFDEVRRAYAEIRNLLVVRLDAMGDNFLFMDGMRKLRKLFPNANLVVITYAENKPIYDRCSFVNKALYVERNGLNSNKAYREAYFKSLRQCPQPWDLLINPLYSREQVAEEVVMAAPARIKIGVAGDNSNISRQMMTVTDKSYSILLPVDNSVVRHELHRNNEILSLLGSQDEVIQLEASLTDGDRQFADKIISEYVLNDFGVVFPGTKGGTQSIKYWGSENYASLMDELKLNGSWELLMLLGGLGEEQIAAEISAATRAKPHVFQGDLSFWQAAALLERAQFYVGSDTSMAHVAAALKVPTFVLLGGGHYGRFFPYPNAGNVTCLTHKLECFNCYWKCNQPYNKCIADISVKEVVGALAGKNLAKSPQTQTVILESFYIGARQGNLPKVDLVLPPGMQTWHLKESWAMTLEKSGCLHRVFRPTPETTGKFLNYLNTGGEADFLLAIGGDHHLGFLHDTEEKREAWQKYRGLRVCNSFESTRDSLYKRYVTCVKSAMKAFTHFAYTDEVDANIFEAAGVPALWWPQAADHRLFANLKDWSQRKPDFFFCGKVWNEYPLRKALLQKLQSERLCTVIERASAGEMAAHYNEHRFAINLPGVLGGFNVRTYEAMSCGALLLQFQPSHRPANNALFQNGKHLFFYDYTNTDKLIAIVRQMVEHPAEFFDMARDGHKELLAAHTIQKRFAQLVEWLFDGRAPDYPQYHFNEAARQESLTRRYVNDRYLFEGRPLWNNHALNEFSDLQFVNYHALLPHLCQQGEQLALAGREVESVRVLQRALEADSEPDQVHNNLGVVYWNRGQRHKALEHFEAALIENPHYRPAVINYGEALTLAGRTRQAREIYSNYLQQNDADDGVKILLANLN